MSESQDDPFLIAGEYVLGTLDFSERLQAQALQARDPAFASAVAFWEDALSPLTTLVAPVPPPAQLWSRLELATGSAPKNTPDGKAMRPANQNSPFWKFTTAAAVLVAAGLALVAFLPGLPLGGGGGQLAAALGPLNATVPFLAQARPDGQIVVSPLGTAAAPPGRVYQLWELPSGATAPRSLGLLTPGQPIAVQAGGQALQDAKLLISDEPAGGSPTGQPTGAVLFGGTLTPVAPPGR